MEGSLPSEVQTAALLTGWLGWRSVPIGKYSVRVASTLQLEND
jgi:hypothetical protein